MQPRARAEILLLACALAGCSLLEPAGRTAEAPPPSETLLAHAHQLTFAGRRAGEGYFGADGTQLVFQSEREPDNPFFQIYLLDLASGSTRRVSPGTGKTTCAWLHPAGGHVLFSSTHLDPAWPAARQRELEQRATARRYAWDFDEHYDLFVRDLASEKLRRLTRERGYDAESSWSPDGRWIAFASNRHAYAPGLSADERERLERDPSYFMEIYLMDAEGGRVRRLTHSPGYDGGPFFSPDGRRIVWRRFSEAGDTAEIFSMDSDGQDVRQLTRLGAMSWAPFYHPSGAYVIFTTNLHGFDNFELYLVDAEGRSEPLRVTYTPGFDGLPAFSPDGERLAWTSTRTPDGAAQLFLADWDHASARSLIELRSWGAAEAPEAGTGKVQAETSPAIAVDDLRAHVEALASEQMEGRLTGTAGEKRATEYVAAAFERMGLEPAGSDGSFFGPFEFTAGVSLGAENTLELLEADGGALASFRVERDWRPLAFSSSGPVGPSAISFAGYGIVAPGATGQPPYDAYAGLEVAHRWVLVLRYLPEEVAPERRQYLARFSSLRYKAMLARERGALGLIVASGPRSRVKRALVPLSVDAAVGGSSLPVLSVTDELAEALLEPSGRDLGPLQRELDGGEPLAGFDVPAHALRARIELVQETQRGRNVLARLPGRAGRAPLVIGAHVDHLGRGSSPDSLARDDERNAIHYGADDNASGVAALLEIAERLASARSSGELALERDVLFAAWSGEELGLLGSSAFVEGASGPHHTGAPSKRSFAAYLNLDMVGRLRDELVLYGAGSSPAWPALVERANVPIGLPIALQEESYLPTDATAFYLKGVPILAAFTGSHPEYHTPRDTPDRLSYDGMQQVARLFAALARSLASTVELPEYRAVQRPEQLPPRAGLRAYLGTIPSYGRVDVRGVKLAGVAEGGPGDRAGLRADDVIVELAGRAIENIYDYTYAIDALKIDEPVSIAVERDGQRVELEITPASRE